MKYGYTKQTTQEFQQAVESVKDSLATEGFGVLTEIDVQTTLKKKLDVDFDNYIILGACNPKFAYKALQTEQEIGLLLPCNVIVYEKENETFVSAILPTVAMNMIDSPELQDIAETIEQKLKTVINNLT